MTQISLADYPMPIFDQDLEKEKGLPDAARKLKAQFQRHNGVFIASPEYNTAVTPLLKNTLDWVSRQSEQGEAPASAYKDRVFALGAASPGALGGMRGLMGLRTILEIGLGALVIPNMVTVPNAGSAFDEHGRTCKRARRQDAPGNGPPAYRRDSPEGLSRRLARLFAFAAMPLT